MEEKPVKQTAVSTLALLVIVGSAIMMLSPSSAHAQSDREVLALARMVTIEGKNMWVSDTEVAMLVHVILKRTALPGTSSRLVEVARAYSPVFATCNAPRNWHCNLNSLGTRPRNFPSHLIWGRYRTEWLRIYKMVRRTLRGDVADPCPLAMHWAAPYFVPRGAVVRVCTGLPVENYFYRTRR